MQLDTLSDVLRVVRLSGAVFFSVDASSPWVAETPCGSSVAPKVLPGVEHVIFYHVVTAGTCWGGLLDEPAVQLVAGDVIVFPQGDPHVMSSEPGMRGAPDAVPYAAVSQRSLPIPVSILGGGNEQAAVICGYLGCDARPFNPLLTSLPRMLLIRAIGDYGSVLRRLVDLALAESSARTQGSDSMLSSLSELLFVEVVRRHLAALPPDDVSWFAGLRDEGIGRAIQLLHQRPAHPWSLEDLAKGVGMSRSLLADRFAHFVGTPPMQYLAQWRIQLAATLLRTSTASLAEIAGRVGYGSEAALSRAFKRWVGLAPAHYRRDTPLEAQAPSARQQPPRGAARGTSPLVARPHSPR